MSIFYGCSLKHILVPRISGVYISVRKQYLSPPPPLLKMILFPPLATSRFSTPIVAFLPKFFSILHLFYPVSSLFLIFFPLSSFFFPLSSFFFPLSSFFFYIFPLFLFPFSNFFPQMASADIPPPGGGGIFQYIDPCSIPEYYNNYQTCKSLNAT